MGVFFAFLIIAWENDKLDNYQKLNIFAILFSWILVFMYVIGTFLEHLWNYTPSLKAFLKIFQKQDYKNR